MAVSGTKRSREHELLDLPGSFPDRYKTPKRRLNSWSVQPKSEGGNEGIISYILSPFRLAATWLTGTKAPSSSLRSAEQTQARRQRTKERVRQANGSYEHHLHQRRQRQHGRRKPLIGGHSHGSRKSRNMNLVREYTTPSGLSAGASRRGSQMSLAAGSSYYTPTPSPAAWSKAEMMATVDDAQSILSVDSSVYYRATPPALFSQPSERSVPALASDQWFARLRQKIEATLSVSLPTAMISTPAYDRLVSQDASFDARIAKARQEREFTLPADAPAVLKKALAPGFTAELNNVPVTAHDISTLGDGQWLNDEVINFYMQLIIDRSQKTPVLPKVHAFNTFFYSTLSEKGYARVRRWTRRIKLFENDLVVVPVHLGVHWCCAIIDFRSKRITYYDALLGDNSKCLRLLMDYLKEESRDKCNQEFDDSGWTMACDKQIPRQRNGYDCGVFAVVFAEYAARDAPFRFSQEHCMLFRRKITYEIATKTLISGIS
ncbi:hypothetical protein EV183_000048 [Coemansia sp. RSA 2336]|nr:hypothetical protein EV183_000670 [Coemansia sp. RSA 2336]KAJ2456492.1 hypothetical protein EV183_000048 [Coemansia sp. RSA 2336]